MPRYQADPADWLAFAGSDFGQRILLELNYHFASGSCYVAGGHEAERQTLANAAQRDVLDYMAQQIQQASVKVHQPEQTSELPDTEKGHDL